MTRRPQTAARRGSFRAPRRVAAPGPADGPGASTFLVWLQYAAMHAEWLRWCPGCRDMRWIHGDHQMCGQCRSSLTAARDAGWLSQVKRWNQERTR